MEVNRNKWGWEGMVKNVRGIFFIQHPIIKIPLSACPDQRYGVEAGKEECRGFEPLGV